jgi:transcriptional regulator with XRE-family HTH domain
VASFVKQIFFDLAIWAIDCIALMANKGSMKNRISEWRKKRGMTLADLATRINTSEGQLSRLERGLRRLDTEWLEKISLALHTRPVDLVRDGVTKQVPVAGYIGAGAQVYPIDDSAPLDNTDLPPGIEWGEDLRALIVRGDSNEPMMFAGWYVFYYNNQRTEGGCQNVNSNVPHVVWLADDSWFVKVVRRGYTPERYNLHSVNKSYEIIPDVEIKWCAPIVAIVPK